MMDLTTEVSLAEIEKRLGEFKKDAPKVLVRALNDTARQAQKDLFAEAKKTYVAKSATFKSKGESLKIKKATAKTLAAILNSAGGPLPLYGFKVKANESSTKGQVKKAGGLKSLYVDNKWAFVATMKSGHVGVFQRKSDERFPIKELLSVSVPQMIGNEEEVYGKLEPEIGKNLQEHIDKEIDKLLKRKAAAAK